MIRAILLAMSLLAAIPARAKDNNPFSGATSISVEMKRDSPKLARKLKLVGRLNDTNFRMHCTLNGKPVAEWRREKAGQYRVKLDGEWSSVPPDAAGPMMVLLWAGGARCGHK